MKKHSKINLSQKRMLLITVSLLLLTILLSALLLYLVPSRERLENDSFTAFTDTLFTQQVSSDSLTLHYTVANEKAYGILHQLPSYGTVNTDSTLSCASLENALSALHSFHPEALSVKNRLTYDVLDSYLKQSLSLAPYLLYQEPLNAITGVQAQLPILLAEYTFADTEDIGTYLSLLAETKEYLMDLASFETEKANAGLFMPTDCADDVISQCRNFVSLDADNFLYDSFSSRLDTVTGLTAERKQDYIQRNSNLIQEQVLPGYVFLADTLETLKRHSANQQGLCYQPGGTEYYRHLVASITGSSRDIPDLKLLILKHIRSDLTGIRECISKDASRNLAPAPAQENDASILSEADPLLVLGALRDAMKQVFPAPADTQVEVKDVPESMGAYLSPAFYLTPPIDDAGNQVIYINHTSTAEGLEAFTTLAHEGYPGHLYQYSYYLDTRPTPLRMILPFGGYTEGWATYVEMCSYYNAGLPSVQAAFYQQYHSLLLGLYAYADIGVHCDGWSLADTQSFFSDYGIKDQETIHQIYTLILSDPANYLKYDIGYLEILELKKEAVSQWGDDFSQMRFHKAFLEIGPADFDTIRNRLLPSRGVCAVPHSLFQIPAFQAAQTCSSYSSPHPAD